MSRETKTEKLRATLSAWDGAQFLLSKRSNGYICPTSMRLVGLSQLLCEFEMRWFRWHGAYIKTGASFKNVNRTIYAMLRHGLLEVCDHPHRKNRSGESIKVLRVKD